MNRQKASGKWLTVDEQRLVLYHAFDMEQIMKCDNDLLLQILLELTTPPFPKTLSYLQFQGFEWLTSEFFDQHIRFLANREMIYCEPSNDRRANVVAQITWAGHDFVAHARRRPIWEAAKEAAGDLPFDEFYETLKIANGKAAMMVLTGALAKRADEIKADVLK